MSSIKIAVIGLGYVGLPLAVEFAKKYPVIGFDIKQERVSERR
jgi:UDP-N-acetyl-D-glucosamine/UDP-N-acetyl-D-galactosamine dehydrogenase